MAILQKRRSFLALQKTIETADTLHNLAEASLKTGDYEEAAASYLKALNLRRQVGDKRNVGFELYNLGNLFD